MKKFQLPPNFPAAHLWDVAIWNTSVEAIEAKGYVFHRERDDLDAYFYTEIEDEEIGKMLLLIRDNPPIKIGVDIMVQSDVYREDALSAIRRRFGISDESFSWVTAFPHQPGPNLELLDPGVWTPERLAQVKKESAEWYNARLAEEDQKREDERFYDRLDTMAVSELARILAERLAQEKNGAPASRPASAKTRNLAIVREDDAIPTFNGRP